jgi:SHAQKYF class myb-like DNA-binding protein
VKKLYRAARIFATDVRSVLYPTIMNYTEPYWSQRERRIYATARRVYGFNPEIISKCVGRSLSSTSAYMYRQLHKPRERSERYWSEEEHDLFLEAVRLYGEGNVKQLSEHMQHRTPRQVWSYRQKWRVARKKLEYLMSANEASRRSSSSSSSSGSSNSILCDTTTTSECDLLSEFLLDTLPPLKFFEDPLPELLDLKEPEFFNCSLPGVSDHEAEPVEKQTPKIVRIPKIDPAIANIDLSAPEENLDELSESFEVDLSAPYENLDDLVFEAATGIVQTNSFAVNYQLVELFA